MRRTTFTRTCTPPIKATHVIYMVSMVLLSISWLGAHMPHCAIISVIAAIAAHIIAVIVAYTTRLKDSDSFHGDVTFFIETFIMNIAGIGLLWSGSMNYTDGERFFGGLLMLVGFVIVILSAFFFLQKAFQLVNED